MDDLDIFLFFMARQGWVFEHFAEESYGGKGGFEFVGDIGDEVVFEAHKLDTFLPEGEGEEDGDKEE